FYLAEPVRTGPRHNECDRETQAPAESRPEAKGKNSVENDCENCAEPTATSAPAIKRRINREITLCDRHASLKTQ
ncbi:hypothetical protein, partial [Aureimonas sp. AU40]|uniref:hypothetical protein n=1 Tax=Aureimonas sp. AU40 TaxID=1637747 RepID=UPI001AECE53E